jgi:hypothetical protein
MSEQVFGLPSAAPRASAAVCIIGMHRSGTSITARLLNVLGLNLGPSDSLMGPSPSNPTGHFEHLGFLEINEALLRRFGGSWDNPPRLPPGWQQDSVVQCIAQRAAKLAEVMSVNGGSWGWKEPRTTVLLPFWRTIIPALRYVICIRNPLEVANSLVQRDGMTIAAACALWRRYMQAALEHTAGQPRTLIFYKNFFRDPLCELNRLAEFCGLEKLGHPDRLAGILAKELRHQRRGARALLVHPFVPLDCKLLYLGLRAREGRLARMAWWQRYREPEIIPAADF